MKQSWLALMLMGLAATPSLSQSTALPQRPPRLPYGSAVTLAEARAVADAAAAAAAVAKGSVAIAITDPNGELIFFEQLDDTSVGVREMAITKARFAARFRMPTAFVAAMSRAGNNGLQALPGGSTGGGGVTLARDGRTVGGLGISGMPSGDGDDGIAVAGAAALK